MIATQSKFQCPDCKLSLIADLGMCLGCGKRYSTDDGILDFVGGRFGTQLNVDEYDAYHAINDTGAEEAYRGIKAAVGDRWPCSLGSVVEVGCGTGNLSRAMIAHRDLTDAVLTDVSPDMLRICRKHLDRLGLMSALPVRFATYSTHENCFGAEVFDACVGASVVHHITDVRAFLADVWRILKPGGCAFFTEPAFRYTQVLSMTCADIMAFLLAHEPASAAAWQPLFNWIAEARRGTLLQGDLELLDAYEDKHMFIGEEFEALALEAGFATAEALPSGLDPDGSGAIGGLLARLAIEPSATARIQQLWPSYVGRYMALLSSRDRSPGYILWLTKPITSRISPPLHPKTLPEPSACTEAEVTGGGAPLRWVVTLTAEPAAAGVRVKIGGWCLSNRDVKSVRVTIGGVRREAPVWFPRADVHQALNQNREYPCWNSLCCGIESELLFERPEPGRGLDIDLMFSGNCYVPVVTRGALEMGVPFSVGR